MRRNLFVKEFTLLAHVMWNQIKGKYWWMSSKLWRKTETRVHTMIIDGFYLWLGTIRSSSLKDHDCKARQSYEDVNLLLMCKTLLNEVKVSGEETNRDD